jgi:RNA 2',3'-cyclic 3'-phosphodiesterase
VRLFVALDLPEPARGALARFRDAAADPAVWRPLPDASLHVTLAFLGQRPDADAAAAVVAGLGDRAAPALALAGALPLPPRRPHVLTVAVADPDGGLATLQAAVSDALAAAAEYEPEARPFRPHVTVARLVARAHAPRTVDAIPEPLRFTAGRVVLYRSHSHSVYEPLVVRTLR